MRQFLHKQYSAMKKQNELVGEEQNPNIIEKAVGKMMSGGKHIVNAHS